MSESAVGDTFQAVGGHAYADPLTAPGTVDLSAHVDFQALAHAVEAMGPKAHGPITQSLFLRRLGIEARAQTLKANASRAASGRNRRRTGAPDRHRPVQHGRAVQGHGLCAGRAGTPPGFEA